MKNHLCSCLSRDGHLLSFDCPKKSRQPQRRPIHMPLRCATSSPRSEDGADDCSTKACLEKTIDLNHRHSGRLKRLFGCSPSLVVFRYLLPAALLATTTQTDCPFALTQKRHFPDSMPAIASSNESFHRVPSPLIPPILLIRSCALARSDLFMQLIW